MFSKFMMCLNVTNPLGVMYFFFIFQFDILFETVHSLNINALPEKNDLKTVQNNCQSLLSRWQTAGA